jgi:3-oxoacyl-[acyl-carrier-protein] synthase-3
VETSPVGIRALGSCVGELELSTSDLAHSIGAEADAVRGWIGDLRILVTERTREELGAEAARQCLARAEVGIEDVQALVWGGNRPIRSGEGRRELHVQHLLGASTAFVTEVGTPCTESLTALRIARALIRDEPDVERVLVVFGERQYARRVFGYDAKTYQPVFSDAGAAVLVERRGRHEILGFGDSTDGRYWDYLVPIWEELERAESRAGEPAPTPEAEADAKANARRLRLMVDAVALNRAALERCLRGSGARREDIDHVILTREGARIPHSLLRQLGLPADKLFSCPQGPTHVGMADCFLSLDVLLASGACRSGQLVLLGSRAVGTSRFCLLRI